MPDVPLEWQAAGPSLVSLEQISRARQFVFSASSYDAIADAPVEAGKFEEFQITGITPPITVVVHGENWKRKRAEEDLKRICEYEIKLMEGAPFERYTFILHIGKGAGGGGMEHANSTAIGVPSDEFMAGVAEMKVFTRNLIFSTWQANRIAMVSLNRAVLPDVFFFLMFATHLFEKGQ